MKILDSSEQDSKWERHDARYRLFFFTDLVGDAPFPPNYLTEVCDVIEADLVDVLTFAKEQAAGSKEFALALVLDDEAEGGRGLIWLSGMDLNAPSSEDPASVRIRSIMRERLS
jgi:hypothetical protein